MHFVRGCGHDLCTGALPLTCDQEGSHFFFFVGERNSLNWPVADSERGLWGFPCGNRMESFLGPLTYLRARALVSRLPDAAVSPIAPFRRGYISTKLRVQPSVLHDSRCSKITRYHLSLALSFIKLKFKHTELHSETRKSSRKAPLSHDILSTRGGEKGERAGRPVLAAHATAQHAHLQCSWPPG